MKQGIKKILAMLASSKVLSALFDKARTRYVPVFMFHRFKDEARGVKGHSIEHTRKALSYLRDNDYNVITIDSLVNALDGKETLPPRPVVFTIDDGFVEQLEVVSAIFSEFGYPARIFLIGDFASGVDWPWDYKIEYIINNADLNTIESRRALTNLLGNINEFDSADEMIESIQNRLKRMTTDEASRSVGELALALGLTVGKNFPDSYQPITWENARNTQNDMVSFGPHSMRHSILKEQAAEIAASEISESKALVERELAVSAEVFCFPTGREGIDFDKREMGYVKDAGFRAALSTTPAYVDIVRHGHEDYRYRLPRFGFPDSMDDFVQLCSWVELLKEKLRGNL